MSAGLHLHLAPPFNSNITVGAGCVSKICFDFQKTIRLDCNRDVRITDHNDRRSKKSSCCLRRFAAARAVGTVLAALDVQDSGRQSRKLESGGLRAFESSCHAVQPRPGGWGGSSTRWQTPARVHWTGRGHGHAVRTFRRSAARTNGQSRTGNNRSLADQGFGRYGFRRLISTSRGRGLGRNASAINSGSCRIWPKPLREPFKFPHSPGSKKRYLYGRNPGQKMVALARESVEHFSARITIASDADQN